jgi:enoyl-CoA hydratase
MNLTRAWETMGFRTHQQASNDLQAVVSHTPEFRKFLKELMEQGATPRERMGEHKSDSGSED